MKPDSEKMDSVLHSFVLPFGSLLLLALSRSFVFSQFAAFWSVALRLIAELPPAEEVEGRSSRAIVSCLLVRALSPARIRLAYHSRNELESSVSFLYPAAELVDSVH